MGSPCGVWVDNGRRECFRSRRPPLCAPRERDQGGDPLPSPAPPPPPVLVGLDPKSQRPRRRMSVLGGGRGGEGRRTSPRFLGPRETWRKGGEFPTRRTTSSTSARTRAWGSRCLLPTFCTNLPLGFALECEPFFLLFARICFLKSNIHKVVHNAWCKTRTENPNKKGGKRRSKRQIPMKSSKRSSGVASASWAHPSPLKRVQKLRRRLQIVHISTQEMLPRLKVLKQGNER